MIYMSSGGKADWRASHNFHLNMRAVCLLVSIFSLVHGFKHRMLEAFVTDIMEKWSLLSPTIIFHDEVPNMCTKLLWSLCLTNGIGIQEVATHLAMISKYRKHDGIIFVGGHKHRKLLQNLANTVPSIFTSSIPVFMSKNCMNEINLRLDSNVIFYEEEAPGVIEFVDIFAIGGGPTITKTLGYWNVDEGINLQASMNRWDRRTDLRGTTFRNCLFTTGDWSKLIRDDHENVIGSEGYFQDMLFYITGRLNLTIETVEAKNKFSELLENGSWTGPMGLLQRKEVDVLSIAMGIDGRSYFIDFPLVTYRQPVTLVSVIPKGASPNMWVYVEVFGVQQWVIVIVLLVSLGSVLSLVFVSNILETDGKFGTKRGAKKEYQLNSISSSFVLIYLYAAQMGSHTNSRKMSPRILTLTASFLTFLIFVAFSTDITAEMTSNPSDIPIRTFEDVIKHDYKVVSISRYYSHLLKSAKHGTAKNIVFNSNFKRLYLKPTNISHVKALFEVISEPKTLLYTVFSATQFKDPEIQQYFNQLFALKMDDAVYGIMTMGLQKDSEFLEIFNYYLLKQFETGFSRRLYRQYHAGFFTNENFEMNEPQPLGFSHVMFCFILLAFGICLSTMITIMELISCKQGKQEMWVTRRNNIQEERGRNTEEREEMS